MIPNAAESFRSGWWAVRDSNPGGGAAQQIVLPESLSFFARSGRELPAQQARNKEG